MTQASILEGIKHVAILNEPFEVEEGKSSRLNDKQVVLLSEPSNETANLVEQQTVESEEGRALIDTAFGGILNQGAENDKSEDTTNDDPNANIVSDTTDNAIDEQLKSLSVSSSLDAISETNTPFKARKAPSTNRRPSIQPQLSRAAMLRMGITPPPKRTTSRESLSSTSKENEERRNIPTPKSLSTPKFEVRQTRASHLRRGSETETSTPQRRRTSSTPVDFGNTPGHKRQSLALDVKSVKAPSITPRQTCASRLRTGSESQESNEKVPTRRPSVDTFANTPGHKRTLSIPVKSINSPSIAARENRSSTLRSKRMSIDLSKSETPKRAFNLSTKVGNEKFVEFDKTKVKPIRRG
ncbi:hypothetical protein E3Q11_04033 [Wallemia mellicola]|nr:hypothetical protein E3Q11_04033 [Wallemia mellicola]